MILINGEEVKQEHFSAGELKMKLQPLFQEDIGIVWRYENDAELFTLACIRDFYASKNCYLTMGYTPNARMDRVKRIDDVFTLKTFAKVINSLNFKTVTVWDVHSSVAPALINNCINIDPVGFIHKAIEIYGDEDLALFFPDEGAMKRYGEMFPNISQAFGIKKRNWDTQKIEDYMIIGEENVKDKNVLIIDDICSYGNTFVKAAEALKAAGANAINLYVTHCEEVISKGNVFKCGLFDKVFTTNSFVRSEETNKNLIIL